MSLPTRTLGCLLVIVTIVGCQAPDRADHQESAPAEAGPLDCRCGDPDIDVLGCPAACCFSGESSCENPLCTCVGRPTPSQDS